MWIKILTVLQSFPFQEKRSIAGLPRLTGTGSELHSHGKSSFNKKRCAPAAQKSTMDLADGTLDLSQNHAILREKKRIPSR
jgi:hypothetical protein